MVSLDPIALIGVDGLLASLLVKMQLFTMHHSIVFILRASILASITFSNIAWEGEREPGQAAHWEGGLQRTRKAVNMSAPHSKHCMFLNVLALLSLIHAD